MVTIFKELFSITGRINRKKYLTNSILFAYFPKIVSGAVLSVEDASILGWIIGIIMIIVLLASIVIQIALMIKRLHDLDRHGAVILSMLIPLINIVFFFYLLFTKGTDGCNSYGPDPLDEKSAVF